MAVSSPQRKEEAQGLVAVWTGLEMGAGFVDGDMQLIPIAALNGLEDGPGRLAGPRAVLAGGGLKDSGGACIVRVPGRGGVDAVEDGGELVATLEGDEVLKAAISAGVRWYGSLDR
jgi:hypothetical protein